MKVFFRRIHLYLGLASGLFLLIVCLTGTILVFEDELEHAFHAERYTVAAAGPRLPLAQLAAAVRAAKPKANISSFKVYADPTRSVEISLAGAGRPGEGPGSPRGEGRGAGMPGGKRSPGSERPGEMRGREPGSQGGDMRSAGGSRGAGQAAGGPGGKGGPGGGGGPRLYVNPYTGAILGEMNPRESFFHFVEQIHRGLVAGRVGKTVMGINSILFVFILLTGLVLWWPATRNALAQRLQVKWGSSWKRLNHDFHIVLGFYTSLFLLVVALTGVGMSFDFVGKAINSLTHSPQQRPEPPTSATPAPGAQALGADAALAAARQQAPSAESYAVQLPRDPSGSIQVSTLQAGALTERSTDDVYLDQYSGRVLKQQAYAAKPLGQRIRGLFKPIHTGAIFGWPTKVLAFMVVVLGFTFPITGTLLWWNRTRKAKKQGTARVALA